MLLLMLNEEMIEFVKMEDVGIEDWKVEFIVDMIMREYLSLEKLKGDFCGNSLRMNVFEKLGFLNDEDSLSEVFIFSDLLFDVDYD